MVDVLVRRGEGKEAQISFWVFVYRNVFCKGANVGLGHREEGVASLLTKKVFMASPTGGI